MLALQNDNCVRLIKYIEEQSTLYGCKIVLRKESAAKKLSYLGYFDEGSKKLICYKMRGYEWVGILAHEFSHMRQWVNDAKIWHRYQRVQTSVDSDLVDITNLPSNRKINFKGLPKRKINDLIDSWVLLERDCEIRTVKLLRRFNVPIDTEKYCQEVNLFIYRCAYLKKKGVWLSFTFNRPRKLYREQKQTLALCPKKIIKWTGEIPAEIEAIFDKINSNK